MISQHSYIFECTGTDEKRLLMKMIRFGFRSIGNLEVESVTASRDSDAIEYRLAGGHLVAFSPAANEAKIEVQISLACDDPEEAACLEKRIFEDIEGIVHLDARAGYCCE